MRHCIKDKTTLAEIIALIRSAFVGDELPPDSMIEDIYNRGVVFTRHEYDGEIIGVALVTTDDRRFNEPYIWTIAVGQKYRCGGIGSALLNEVAAFATDSGAKGVSLMVNTNNPTAMRLYLSVGYRVKRFMPRYYGNGGDGVLMRRAI